MKTFCFPSLICDFCFWRNSPISNFQLPLSLFLPISSSLSSSLPLSLSLSLSLSPSLPHTHTHSLSLSSLTVCACVRVPSWQNSGGRAEDTDKGGKQWPASMSKEKARKKEHRLKKGMVPPAGDGVMSTERTWSLRPCCLPGTGPLL